jgi:4-amino-4-deoxy-L-arabinose transferase-like glycosyltransferase
LSNQADTAIAPQAPEADTDADGNNEVKSVAVSDSPLWPSLLVCVGVAAALFFVLPPLSHSGLWDPYELNVADLGRRVALNLHGGTGLSLDGADNSLPHLNDLGRPQLPFTAIALGFKFFGLKEWAGRLPLALIGLLGVASTFGWVSRLIDRRAGAFAALSLCTMPLYFVHARTMLGDITTMASLTMAFGGLAVVVFDRDDQGKSRLSPVFVAMAVLGLIGGWFSRGGLLGVAVPTMAVGLAWLVSVGAGGRALFGKDGIDVRGVVALLCLGLGAFALYQGVVGLGDDKAKDLNLWVGAMLRPAGKYPTFDHYVSHIGHALAPWSAFAPFALGRLYIAPQVAPGAKFSRESETRVAILVAAAVCFVMHGFLVARTELIAFSGPALLAAAAGIALRDYERGAHPSLATAVGTAVFLGVFHHDFHSMPEKAYQAFAVPATQFPESFKDRSWLLWTIALVGFAGVSVLTFVEIGGKRKPFQPANYAQVIRALRDSWDGILSLAYFAIVAGSSLAGLAIWYGTRTHAKWMPQMSGQLRDVLSNAWWLSAIVPLAAVLGTQFWCDVWLWAFGPKEKGEPKVVWARGFEPLEQLLAVRHEPKGETRNVALAVLAPLMYLQIPALVFFALYKQGQKPLVAAAVALPAGILAFLALGVVADLLRRSRAAFLTAFGVVAGGILCFAYYPALANQLSPKEVFESYQRLHKAQEPLGLFGVGGRTAAYYAGEQPPTFKDTQSAFDWLSAAGDGRRFLAISAQELGRLNSTFRAKTGNNLPVLDARSSQILLVTNKLVGGEKNESPLAKVVLEAAPKPQRKLDVNLEDKLQVVGIDIVDGPTGRLVDAVRPGKKYRMRTYLKVLAPIRRVPPPAQRRPQDLGWQVPVLHVARGRLHGRRLRVHLGAQLHSRRVHHLLRVLHRRGPHEGQVRAQRRRESDPRRHAQRAVRA